MLPTCEHVHNMKMIQVRNVPDELHRSLKERAAREGTTMSDLILAQLRRLATKPSPEEILERVQQRTPIPGESAADLIGAERADR
jgi:plasmid stability protein